MPVEGVESPTRPSSWEIETSAIASNPRLWVLVPSPSFPYFSLVGSTNPFHLKSQSRPAEGKSGEQPLLALVPLWLIPLPA